MIINRHQDPAGPASLSIYVKKADAEDASATTTSAQVGKTPRFQMSSSWVDLSKTPEPQPDERVITIDMRSKMADEILDLFLAESNAQVLTPTADQQALLDEYEDRAKFLAHEQSESDRLKKLAAEEKTDAAKAKALALGTSA